MYDLVADAGEWLSPVGRLDLDTSGLLLMTNDTDLAERLTNPNYHIRKTYQVKASTLLSDEQIEQLRQGVELSDGRTRPAEVKGCAIRGNTRTSKSLSRRDATVR